MLPLFFNIQDFFKLVYKALAKLVKQTNLASLFSKTRIFISLSEVIQRLDKTEIKIKNQYKTRKTNWIKYS